MKKIVVLSLVILSLMFLTGCQKKQLTSKIRWGVRVNTLAQAIQIITTEKDFLKKNNVDIEIHELADDDANKIALATNQVDIVSMSATDSFILVAEGVPIKLLAQGSLTPTAVYVRNDEQIKTLSDLKGKKIGGGLGGSSQLFVSDILSQNKIDPTKDVQFIKVKKEFYVTALIKKEVDAIMESPQNANLLIKEGAIVLPEWQSKGYIEQYMPKASIAARTDFVEKNPEAIKKFINAYKEATNYLNNNKEESAQIVADYITNKTKGSITYTKEDALSFFAKSKFAYWVPSEELVALADQAYNLKLIEKKLTIDDIIFKQFDSILHDK